MKKIWKIKKSEGIGPVSAGKHHPVILEILSFRGIVSDAQLEEYFNPNYERHLSKTSQISGLEKAVERIALARERQEKIAIFGDYDADGVSSSVVVFETLKELGMKQVICYIPDRQLEGYGMNETALEYLHQEKVSLIITVDCGIKNIAEVKKAGELGMEVIITDHHDVPKDFPAALSVINPHLDNSGFSGPSLAGVGVAFKLAQGLVERLAPEKKDNLKWLLDLVAIGTVADCVSLLGENRVLVKYGLIVISKTRRSGLREMFQVGRINISDGLVPTAEQVAFQIAPRINAAGRMDHANTAYKLLIENDRVAARNLALELEEKNQDRQKITGEIFREISVLAANSFKDKKFIFAENPHWPAGVLGLVAGKIADEFQKPTAIFQRREDELIGSFRSIPEFNIIEALKKCSSLLVRFGGHAQAAGASLRPEKAQKFYEKISDLAEKELKNAENIPQISVDKEITAEDISWELVREIGQMEPFGEGNEEPVFLVRNLVICDSKIVGNGKKHWKLSLRSDQGGPKVFDAIGFSLANDFPDLKKDDRIDAIFNLREDSWNGNKKIQLRLIDLKKV